MTWQGAIIVAEHFKVILFLANSSLLGVGEGGWGAFNFLLSGVPLIGAWLSHFVC